MMDAHTFDATRFVRPALQFIALYFSIIVISSVTAVNPAHATGNVPPAFVSCSNYLFQNAHTGYEQGGYTTAAAACGGNLGTYAGNGNYYCGSSTELRALCMSPVYSCPDHSQPVGTTCTCTDPYKPDPTGTSCVVTSACPANMSGTPCTCNAGYVPFPYGGCMQAPPACPANMSGTPCTCNAGYVPNQYGVGCDVERYRLSEPQDQTQLPDVEPGSFSAITARVVSVQTGLPKQGAVVRIHLDVDITSGGHDHGEAPWLRSRGSISSNDCVTETVGAGAAPDTYDCTTGADGYTGFNFDAPDVSGTHTITATCISASCSGSKTSTINVKVDGLVPIPDYQFYTLTEKDGKVIGSTNAHINNHYLTPEAATVLQRMAASYHIEDKFWQFQRARKGKRGQYTYTPAPLLHLNDASLIWGGVFDLDTDWDEPHAEHARGTVIDIRANSADGAIPPQNFKNFRTLAAFYGADAGKWPHSAGLPNQHFHLRLLNRSE
jgi:hypothetical protein